MNKWCHLNGCSNRNAKLICSLVHVEIATFVYEFDISRIHWEHVNLNAAYILSRSYQVIIFKGATKGALLLQLLGLQQCNLFQEALRQTLGDRPLVRCYSRIFNLNVRRTTPGAVEIPSCRRDTSISTSIYSEINLTHTSHLSIKYVNFMHLTDVKK